MGNQYIIDQDRFQRPMEFEKTGEKKLNNNLSRSVTQVIVVVQNQKSKRLENDLQNCELGALEYICRCRLKLLSI